MGKILISLDTDSKQLLVKVGKEELPNVREIYAYQSLNAKGEVDGFSLSVTTYETVDDIRKSVTYMASGDEEVQKAEAEGKVVDRDTVPGMVGIEGISRVAKEIGEYFSKKLS